MKKAFTLLFTLLSLILTSAVALANYPTHLNGDSDYILIDGRMGTAWYLDKTTLEVEKYEPPIYIINVDVVSAHSAIDSERDFYSGGSGRITGTRHLRLFYNYSDTKMYIDTTGNDGWKYLPPLAAAAVTRVNMPAGEMAFYLAYGKKFYGAYRWSGNGLKNVAVYDNAFYSKAR